MTPKRLKALWRERWNKPDTTAEEDVYLNGSVGAWGERVSSATPWTLPGLGIFAAILFTGLALILASVRFSASDQWWLSFFILAISLFIRRYQIPLVTFMLLCFATISTSRYLYWRFDATLGPAFSIDFFLALGLWVLEVYGAIWGVLGLVNTLWPAKQAPTTLPDNPADWPSINVFVFGAGRSAEEIERSLAALQEAQWPRDKLVLTVVDGLVRDGLQTLLAATDIDYLAFPNETRSAAGLLSQALAQSKAELAVILTAGQTPSVDFLVDSVGWFHKAPDLGMLCTPRHFLMPNPPVPLMRHLAINEAEADVLITRVSLFLEPGRIPFESLSSGAQLAQKLRSSGFQHAFLIEQAGSKWCLYNPFDTRATYWKLWAERAHDILEVYRPLLGFALLTAPLPYLLADVSPIMATPSLWIAYALPHLTQAYLLHNRVQSTRRLPLLLEIREGFLSVYLLVRTFFTAIWTEFKQRKSTARMPQTREDTSAIRLTLSDHLLTTLHGLAIIMGVVHLLQAGKLDIHKLSFFLAWSVIVLMLQVAKFAVAREARQVAWQKHLLKSIPAMIRLPNNRTVSCQTCNFPAAELMLNIPADLGLALGQDLKLSLFHQTNEFAFTARICAVAEGRLTMKVDAACQDQYAQFSQSVLARGSDWPGWLPGQHVDRIAPQWLITVISWPLELFVHLIHRFNRKPVVATADNVNMKWKKKA